jgi:cystathionine beta-synthase
MAQTLAPTASAVERNRRPYASVLDTVGWTPLIRLNRVTRGVRTPVYGKAEFFNPGGSVKDRIGMPIIEQAERDGTLKPGGTIVEGTSGNTGVGLAIAAALKGYRCIFTMPDKMSQEKVRLLKAFGADVIVTPTAVPPDHPDNYVMMAKRIAHETPNAILANQFYNQANPEAHYATTGPEIWEQTEGKITHFVAAAGTGGTITGVAKVIKRELPHCEVVGVDPEGSILAGPGEIRTYKVEGIGYDFIPDVLDRSLVDRWIKSNDRDSFVIARQLIRQEGLLVGGSSGAAVWAAMQIGRELGPGKRVCVILPDSIRNYLSKFVDDRWMRQHGFLRADWEVGTVGDIARALGRRSVICLDVDDKIERATQLFKQHGISQMPVLDQGRLVGIVTESDLLHHLVSGKVDPSATIVAEVMERKVSTVSLAASSSELPRIFERGEVAIVVDDDRRVLGLLTKMDLIEMLQARKTTMPRA